MSSSALPPDAADTAKPSERLAELGLLLPAVPSPAGAYVPAVRDGDLVWTAGQLPLVGGKLAATGLVGDEISTERAAELARVCALNALAAAAAVAGGLDSLVRIVKVVGFVASAPGFADQPTVVNGASELLGAVFGDAGRHARSAVGVAALPLWAPVEIELVARVRG
ncbi:Enamine deaminase RidA, house cleaning of reactive enamine intermediates, YjgF/YER057c/UK114 family [Parafrankia irregularis]|uniref:Enamine deaminase RidA, house cleaning of reactive enamine intermediates, YjgF/YER057c/UK114 family n=1 Tax=Parafrankia irregularis TaxID=795642 RepID=A0A0S4QVD5_9ACTN|nr:MULTISPECIES: RidA family protein [Parafrankia]MBE3204574.1 RidA family protein [Parafrankia sp. CH37]CUU58426.1 Enamine deaminase RidA, house cleaning of reactive enamine intermediates, YjgF/YER057c/UK114 family [Parafrankia irregularis]